jgi:hypothetical protein
MENMVVVVVVNNVIFKVYHDLVSLVMEKLSNNFAVWVDEWGM